MINLDATDVLEGIASVDAVVKFTVSGRDETDGLISKEGTAGNTNTEFYTAVGITLIYSVTLYNSHSSAVTLTLNKDPANAGILYPYFSVSLGVGYSLVFDGQRFTTMDASGNITSSLANPMDAAGELIYGGANGVMTALDAGATTKILVGGGAAAPVWTEATGTGAPVRAGAPTFTGQPIIPTINLTGGQIAFPATAVPSADANTMDDWEEGTWGTSDANGVLQPNDSGTITCGTSYEGWYVKIGKMVTVGIRAAVSAISSPVGPVSANNLPFTCVNDGTKQNAPSAIFENLTAGPIGTFQGYVMANGNRVRIGEYPAHDLSDHVQVGTTFGMTLSYII